MSVYGTGLYGAGLYGVGEDTAPYALTWDDPTTRTYEQGVDRGVFYPPNGTPVVWNGLFGIDESGNHDVNTFYIDGQMYFSAIEGGDYTSRLSCYTYPDIFSNYVGLTHVDDASGLFVDNQMPRMFGMSYRSLVGSGSAGDLFGYKIHLVYNALATIGDISRRTIGASPEPTELEFDLICKPIKLAGHRPSAHYILDTRFMSKPTVASLETLLYGTGLTPGRLPSPTELYEILHLNGELIFTSIDDYTWKVEGPSDFITDNGDGTWSITNTDAVDQLDGTYIVPSVGT